MVKRCSGLGISASKVVSGRRDAKQSLDLAHRLTARRVLGLHVAIVGHQIEFHEIFVAFDWNKPHRDRLVHGAGLALAHQHMEHVGHNFLAGKEKVGCQ